MLVAREEGEGFVEGMDVGVQVVERIETDVETLCATAGRWTRVLSVNGTIPVAW